MSDSARVLVVCPNLAIDCTLGVEPLRPGGVHRAKTSIRQAGGKGVNAARALTAMGCHPIVCGFVGGRVGDWIRADLREEGIEADLVPFSGESRLCIILLSPDSEATVVNEKGPLIEDPDPLFDRFEALLSTVEAVAFMGSLPPGLPSETYANMVSRCRRLERPCLVDTSGVALEKALAVRPTYAKPNREEAESLLARSLRDETTWVPAAEAIRARGPEVAFVTLGSRGAALAAPGVKGRLEPPKVHAVNPTGAGDAFAAGVLAAHLRGERAEGVGRWGVAAAAASLRAGYGRIGGMRLRAEAVSWKSV